MTKETTQTDNSVSGKLLTVEEKSACGILAEGNSLQSRRAQALLALDEGATHKDASEQTGLTIGQVNYWLRKFRNGHMTIFPEAETTPADDPEPQSEEMETAVILPAETEADQPIAIPDKKLKKVKKGRPAMKAQKSKKEKKVKPTKKAKKSSKKSKKSAKPKKKGDKKKSDKKPKKNKKKSGKKTKKKK